MKLAYLLSEYPTLGHTYLLREVRQLRAMGWDIQTLSVRRPGNRPSPLSPEELEELNSTWYIVSGKVLEHLKCHAATFFSRPVRYCRGLRTALSYGRLEPRRTVLAMAYFAEAVYAGYRIHKAGLTHVHSVYTTTIGLILSQIFDVHLSMTLHGPMEFNDPEGTRLRDKVHAAEVVGTISYFARSQTMLWAALEDWHKLEVTPLGVDANGWELAPFRETPSPFELIAAGRLAAIKGFPLLLEAVAALCRHGHDVRLTLAGDGPARKSLEEQAQRLGLADRVVFTGWKSQDELRALYRQSDVFVMSSFAEGVPVVLMEAMATGVPCVAPRINGIPELIRDGVDGLLFTVSDVAGMASTMERLMNDTEMRRRMSESSRARVAEKYDLAKNVDHLSEVLKKWLAAS